MKHARPRLEDPSARSGALLTTGDVAALLRVHPKHVYRLLRRGLPGRRVGGEWRFLAGEVLAWSEERAQTPPPSRSADSPQTPPSLVAANGDVAVERLLARLSASGPRALGLVLADRARGLELLARGEVLAAGCHGDDVPGSLGGERLAFVRLVDRQVGLALRRGLRLTELRRVRKLRLASRPRTAGVRAHLDRALSQAGLDADVVHAGAVVLSSHQEVACAVSRGEVDVGLASAAWTHRVGLELFPICREPYGLLVRAGHLGDPRVVRLCEVAQESAFRRELAGISGYEARSAGTISYRPATASGTR